MKPAQVKLASLSICPCGGSVLDDSILLGTEYTVYPESIRTGFRYGCGACGRICKNVSVILADQILDPDAPPRYLPLDLFDLKGVAA